MCTWVSYFDQSDSSLYSLGLLHSGDVIHEINGQSVKGFSVDDVADLMVSQQFR